MSNELFEDHEDGETELPEIDPSKDYFQELVGEGKKFNTPQDLARGKYEADVYVRTLEKRLDSLRDDYLRLREDNTSRAKLQDLVDQLNAKQISNSESPNANEVNREPVNLEDVESRIFSKIEQRELKKVQDANLDIVKNKLKERFGSNYQSAIKEQTEALGLSPDDIVALAKKSPTAFFKTLGLDQQQTEQFTAPPRSNQRSDNFAPKVQKRTWSYYQNLKKTNPNAWLDPKTAVQMQDDYLALGDAFEDGDFHTTRRQFN